MTKKSRTQHTKLKSKETSKLLSVAVAAALLVATVIPAPVPTHALTADQPITYTLEPADYDGYPGINMNITKDQLGGAMCPCVKIPYVADPLPWKVQKT